MSANPYLDLTNDFNQGRLRCILSSGQAVVMHKLAVMSKDGDWIARENQADLDHILAVLEARGAKYRLGAPLDVRWMAGGWSAHFEFAANGYRARADFVTRPPRIALDDLEALWREQEAGGDPNLPVPTIDLRRLAELKKTNRERDYAVIGELARLQNDVKAQFSLSRSARDLMELAAENPEYVAQMAPQRPVLSVINEGRDALEAALDAERRILMRKNEERLAHYAAGMADWQRNWLALEREMAALPLRSAHQLMVKAAEKLLPMQV